MGGRNAEDRRSSQHAVRSLRGAQVADNQADSDGSSHIDQHGVQVVSAGRALVSSRHSSTKRRRSSTS